MLKYTWEEHPDFPYLKKALVRIQEVAEFVNEQKRYRENLTKILEVYNSLTGIKTEIKSELLIGQKNVWYIQDGSVWEVMMSARLRRYHLFLFNLFLIFTKPSKSNQYEFIKSVAIEPTTKVETRTADDGYKMVYLSSKEGIFMFRGETNEETHEWFLKLVSLASGQFNVSQEKKEREKETKPKEKTETVDTRRDVAKSRRRRAAPNRSSHTPTLLPKKLKELKEREDFDRKITQQIDEETKSLREWEKCDDSDELEKFEVTPEEMEKFECFSQEIYSAFHEFLTAATKANLSWEVPEVVLIGRKEEGKTSVVESLLGHPLPPYSRPVIWHLVNNPKRDKVQMIIHKDKDNIGVTNSPLPEGRQIQSFTELETELMNRSKTFSLAPIHITYESKNVFNMRIIDPPGLESFTLFEEWYQFYDASKKKGRNVTDDRELVKEFIRELAKNEHRILVFVEECKDISLMPNITKIAFKFDPTLSRSLFVYTKFAYKLRNFTDVTQCSLYLNLTRANAAKSFLATYISPKVRQKLLKTEKPNEYRKKLFQFYKRDLKYLETLQFDKSFLESLGPFAVRKQILSCIIRHYQRIIPTKLSQLRALKCKLEEQQSQDTTQERYTLDTQRIRSLAVEFVFLFGQNFNKRFEVYSLSNAEKFGQTVPEEFQATGLRLEAKYGKQFAVDGTQITRTWYRKCYGRAQLFRVFTVFEYIVQSVMESGDKETQTTQTPSPTPTPILTTTSKEQTLTSLLNDLSTQCQYILKRLVRDAIDETLQIIQFSPPEKLIAWIRDSCEKAVDKIAADAISSNADSLFRLPMSVPKVDAIRTFISRCYQIMSVQGIQEITGSARTKIATIGDDELTKFWQVTPKSEQDTKGEYRTTNELNLLSEAERSFVSGVNRFWQLSERG